MISEIRIDVDDIIDQISTETLLNELSVRSEKDYNRGLEMSERATIYSREDKLRIIRNLLELNNMSTYEDICLLIKCLM